MFSQPSPEQSKKVLIVVGSTRPGRVGRAIADWFYARTKEQQSNVEFELVDLADWNLPLLDEPIPPKAHMYQQEHTKRWSDKIASADGYILVTPEYNHGYPASLKNALDYLYREWNGKPVAFVSYGMGGGQLAVKQLHQVVEELQLRPLGEQLAIFFEPNMFDERHQMINPNASLAKYEDAAHKLVQALSNHLKEEIHETA